jgi:hypothetical protein
LKRITARFQEPRLAAVIRTFALIISCFLVRKLLLHTPGLKRHKPISISTSAPLFNRIASPATTIG